MATTHTIKLTSKTPLLPEEESLECEISFANNQPPEHLAITSASANLTYLRGRRETAQRAQSNQRHLRIYDRIACVQALSTLVSASFSSLSINNGKDEAPLNLPGPVSEASNTTSAFRGNYADQRAVFAIGASYLSPVLTFEGHGKAVFTAASYHIGSYRSLDEISRFRLLWSGFNALYNEIAPDKKGENAHLTALADLIVTEEIQALRTKYLYEKFGSSSLLNELHWFAFASAQLCKKGSRGVSYDKKWEVIDSSIASRLRPLAHDSKLPHGDALAEKLALYEEQLSEPKQIAFLITWYLYYVRCSSMHGNRSYPLYSTQYTEKALPSLCDLLEASILDIAEHLLKNA